MTPYNVPDDEPQLPPPPSYLNAPPPSGVPAYTSAPPPPSSAFPPPFDPSAFPPPFDPAAFPPPGSYQPEGRATYQAPDAPAPTPAFDPAQTSFDTGFDPSAYSAPAYDAGFDPSAFAAPTSFDASAFNSPPDDSIPTFDSGAFDAPPFDLTAFDAPPVVAPVWDAPAPETAASPHYEATPAPPVSPPETASFEAQVVPPIAPVHGGERASRRAERMREEAEAAALAAAVWPQPPVDLPGFTFGVEGPELQTKETEPGEILNLGQGQVGTDPDLIAALNIVVSLGGSDLHVSVGAVPLVRIDGGLQAMPGFDAWDVEKTTSALHSIMSAQHRDQFENELELDFAYTLSAESRFRVNIYQQRGALGAAFRLIPTEIKQLAALGIPEKIGKFAQLPRGLVLVTGPTGSGKSTTLAALIDLVNSTRADHIVTVEDPIEFMHQNKKSLVNQREVGHDTHSFNNALKHVLRQDPDVILIGELRDLETISVALTAAETGHLVFATLHTQDAAQTVDRVIDVFPPHQQGQVRAQLAATLQGVVCQTLVKKLRGGGRAVATEVMITTPAISNLIREGKTYQIHSAMQAGRDAGMHTLDQHLADLVNAGEISHAAAHEKAHDLEDLKQLIQRMGGSEASASMGGNDFGDAHYPPRA
ncbi:PilT/PilU family type 4a pilus ATPase [Conyzicola sp.]|uniref:PilT/PilU family type 4a pilus ATPase n=1 Tax=Conyzicola sp. TaxID=1969404 RepID=UPI003989655A